MKNIAILIGNLGKDPELRYTAAGKAVCTLSIATNLVWKKADGSQGKRTDWHKVELWDGRAENAARFLHKGSLVAVEGRIQNDYVGEGDNVKFYSKIVAQDVKYLDRVGGNGNGNQQPEALPEEEEIPF